MSLAPLPVSDLINTRLLAPKVPNNVTKFTLSSIKSVVVVTVNVAPTPLVPLL